MGRTRLLHLGAALALAGTLTLLAAWSLAAGPYGQPSVAADGPSVRLTQVVTGLDQPLHVTHAGDGSGRLFVVEKAGRIRIVTDGSVSSTPFLDIRDRVGSTGREQGLLSVAFPSGYAEKGAFYVDYTDRNGDTVVARYHVSGDPDRADPESETVILTQTQPFGNHNGGQLAFGPDGYLYIGLGDGGSAGDPQGNAQDPSTWLGKILRIDVEPTVAQPVSFTAAHRVYLPLVTAGTSVRYRVPASNPYTDTPGHRDEIWALGLRNPWRFSFDRATGDLYIGDVGQASYEEIDFQPASGSGGENYGWNIMEGAHCYPEPPCDRSGLVLPVAEYDHSLGRSVTGGFVYRGPGNPGLRGVYLYGDYGSGRIWGLMRDGEAWQTRVLSDTEFSITSFGEDEAGNLYLTDFRHGAVYAIAAAP